MSFNIEHLKQRPHLVILGAGATIATIPAGDKYGRKSSVMDNFISELQLNDLFKNIQLKTIYIQNFMNVMIAKTYVWL